MIKRLFSLLLALLMVFAGAFAWTGDVLVDDGFAMTDEIAVEWGYDYLATDEVALYLYAFGELPPNYLTKDEARDMGWVSNKGNLWSIGYGLCIGGDSFGNREGLLPEGEEYRECDVNYTGGYRGAERLVYSIDDYDIYYTADHYESFEQVYSYEEGYVWE